jgi:hypothetical protein
LNKVEIKKRFAYHRPSPEAVEKLGRLRKAFSDFEDVLNEIVPQTSREKSLAFTKLEECSLFANKAVTHNDPGSVPDIDDVKLSDVPGLGLTEATV